MGETIVMSTSTITQKDIMDAHFDKRVRDFLHTTFPAEITRVVRSGVVDIKPLISTKRPDGQIIPYPEIFDVRIQHFSANAHNVFISLPYKVGDRVWCFVSERDVDALMKLNRVEASVIATHDLSDIFCIPSFVTDQDGVADIDPDNLVIGNKSTRITVKEDNIVIDTQEYQLNASIASTTADNIELRGKVGFNDKSPISKPTITGSKGGNAALTLLLTELQNYGLIVDATT